MTPQRLIAAGVALALVAWAWLWWTSPERRVHATLDRLEALMTKEGAEQQVSAWANSREVVGLFADGFVIMAAPYQGTLTGERELAAAVYRYRTTGKTAALGIHDREIELGANRTAGALFVATVTMDRGRGPDRESYRVRARLQEEEGDWLIAELEVIEVLEGTFDWF